MHPERHRACCELRLNVRRIVPGGGGVAGQHLPQAEVDEVVPPVVPRRTIGVHACLEDRIRVRPVSDEVRHCVYQTPGTPPEGRQLHGIGGDWKRHLAIEDWASYGQRRRAGRCGVARPAVLLQHAQYTTRCVTC